MNLLSDAEVLEDVVEGVLAGDATTEDAFEGIDDGVEVFGNEVATEVRLESVDDVLECSVCLLHGIVMTLVGEDDIALCLLREACGTDEYFAEMVKAEGVLGT